MAHVHVHVYLVGGNEYVPFQENMQLTKCCDCGTAPRGSIEEVPVIIIMKLNIAIAFLYHPLSHDNIIFLSVIVQVLGFDYYTSAAQGGGRAGVDGEDHVDRYRLVHEHKFVAIIITIIL